MEYRFTKADFDLISDEIKELGKKLRSTDEKGIVDIAERIADKDVHASIEAYTDAAIALSLQMEINPRLTIKSIFLVGMMVGSMIEQHKSGETLNLKFIM